MKCVPVLLVCSLLATSSYGASLNSVKTYTDFLPTEAQLLASGDLTEALQVWLNGLNTFAKEITGDLVQLAMPYDVISKMDNLYGLVEALLQKNGLDFSMFGGGAAGGTAKGTAEGTADVSLQVPLPAKIDDSLVGPKIPVDDLDK